ncbi:hypothetical protein ColKHC_04068 [Colletotrichum higginsianum]|nr:hypothetical protein ColKHC_04068 [Colletotrichum higginsianum]
MAGQTEACNEVDALFNAPLYPLPLLEVRLASLLAPQRHEAQGRPLERMWGNVAADVLLWHFQLLGDADLEALYCTSVRSLVGLLVCQWDCGITILEMFYAVRRDLDKPCFNPLKSAVQRADTAMRKYITAHVARVGHKEQEYRRWMVSDAFLAIEDKLREHMGEEEHLFLTERWSPPLPLLNEDFGLFS